jgi:DNA polymerase-3 subunit beta
VKEGVKFILDGELLKRIIDLTVFAVSKETYSPAPQGVLLDVKRDHLRMVATDGHRLAFMERKGEFDLEESAIISEKTAKFASRLTGDVEIRMEEQVAVSIQRTPF